MALIVAQWTNALNARSEFHSAFTAIRKPNYGMMIGFVIAFGLQMLVMFCPLKTAFDIESVPITTLLSVSGIMAVSILLVSEVKQILL